MEGLNRFWYKDYCQQVKLYKNTYSIATVLF
jgi:hypothetical protein